MTHTDLTTTNRPMRSQRRRPWPIIGAAVLAAAAVLTTAGCAERSIEPPHSYPTDGGPTRVQGGRDLSAGPQLIPAAKPVQPARSGIPNILVGTWDGGSQPNQAGISFSPAGDFRLTYPNGFVIDGIVVVNGSTMTFYLPRGNRQTVNWSVEKIDAGYGYAFLSLSIDGHSYVRQISG